MKVADDCLEKKEQGTYQVKCNWNKEEGGGNRKETGGKRQRGETRLKNKVNEHKGRRGGHIQ